MSTPSLDAVSIARLVDRFYDRVRADALLGAVFNPVVADWDEHKRLLTSFWCSVVLRAGTYRGNPMAKHLPHAIGAAHFERWLRLWGETVHEVLDADAAAVMIEYATRIGDGLRLGLGLPRARRTRTLGIPVVGSNQPGNA
ncbi:MAG: group III truncated hemoglobin [Proteobacteria bacterium]|nr:group III truncated hemoglobin [Pseudomonadota bacterium]